MTDSMKCPFCGLEFDIMKGISDSVLGCPKCKHIATIGVWEALIDGKKAQDALKEIVNFFDIECEKDDLYFYNLIDDNIAKYREIISITKREK